LIFSENSSSHFPIRPTFRTFKSQIKRKVSKRVHFIAVGGSIMHNLAIALAKKGYQVTGSDDQIFSPSKERLAEHNILPKEMGWHEENIHPELDEVVLGMHAKADNPELLKAQKLGLKIYSFPEYIYKESQNKQRIVICGSHGKTTITSMIMHVLKFCGKKFDYAVAAQLEGFDTMVKLEDSSPIIIIEGDEYLSSPIDRTPKFFRYQHHICSVSGISWDHINVFPTFENYVEQFEKLIDSTPKGGSFIYNEDDTFVRKIAKKHEGDYLKFAYKAPKSKIKEGVTSISIDGYKTDLQIFGEHNLSNLGCAHKICSRLAITDEDFIRAIASYKGANKRLTLIAKNAKTNVYLDFAHAPSKLEATVKAVSEQFSKRKLVGIFELHTFSSLDSKFIVQYKDTMKKCDEPYLFLDPEVLKKKGLGLISESQLQGFFNDKRIKLIEKTEDLEKIILAKSWKDKNLLLMSSGNFAGAKLTEIAQKITA
jgi:UDP-N-acetylmuramate: L-alanyl-gamma-D-glutamyl-meso-diaminopimelate ligase